MRLTRRFLGTSALTISQLTQLFLKARRFNMDAPKACIVSQAIQSEFASIFGPQMCSSVEVAQSHGQSYQ